MKDSIDDVAVRLEKIRAKGLKTPQDASQSAEAALLLGELLRWLQDARRVIDGTTSKGDAERPSREPLEGLTLHEAAWRVLGAVGKPLHAKDLASLLKEGGWKHPRATPTRPNQLVHQIAARLPKYPGVFERVAPNTFGLAEWTDPEAPGRDRGL